MGHDLCQHPAGVELPDPQSPVPSATGYQPGGPNVVAPGLPPAVDSSMLTSYELGLKSGFADNRVLLDVVAYQIDWEDIQVASQVNGVSGLVNGDTVMSTGSVAPSLRWRTLCTLRRSSPCRQRASKASTCSW